MSKKVLGRGLESLISGIEQNQIRNIPLSQIKPNPYQPRKVFTEDELKDLSQSIKENGVIQPIIVRKSGEIFEIIAGERRYRASQMLQLKDIPAVVKNVNDLSMLEYAIIENVQREDLNPIDEAGAYRELQDKFHLTHEQIGEKVGKSRPHITNIIRLLELESHIRSLISAGKISTGHAKVLLSVKDKGRRMHLADYAAKNDVSVRELELMSGKIVEERKQKKPSQKKDIHINKITEKLCERMNRKVEIRYRKGKGSIVLDFYNDDDFHALLEKLGLKNID